MKGDALPAVGRVLYVDSDTLDPVRDAVRTGGVAREARGIPQIEVSFDIDANGILKVSAKDKATTKEKDITITNSSGLSQSEVENMVNDAQAHEEEDKRRREAIEAKNHLDTLIYSTEKSLAEFKEKMDGADVEALEVSLADAKTTMAEHDDDKAKLEAATEALTKAAHKLAELMYKEAAAADSDQATTGNGSAAHAGAGGGGGDDVVDAEIVDD